MAITTSRFDMAYAPGSEILTVDISVILGLACRHRKRSQLQLNVLNNMYHVRPHLCKYSWTAMFY